MRVKICGLSGPTAITAAVSGGVDALGFVFSPSPRQVSIDEACALVGRLPPFITTVAVFRHPPLDLVEDVVTHFRPHVVQTEPDSEILRLIEGRVTLLPVFHDHAGLPDEACDYHAVHGGALLLEGPGQGGRGVKPDWDRAAELARNVPLVLAGGLDEKNVLDAIDRVRPYAVDVSSGVESAPGVKSPDRIRSFLTTVRDARQMEHAE